MPSCCLVLSATSGVCYQLIGTTLALCVAERAHATSESCHGGGAELMLGGSQLYPLPQSCALKADMSGEEDDKSAVESFSLEMTFKIIESNQ